MRVGDIPYSEALGGEKGNFTPRYDTQKDVIAGVLDELDEAYELFSQARISQATSSSAASPTSGCARSMPSS